MLTIYNVDTKNNKAYHLRTVYSGIYLCSYVDESICTIYNVYNRIEIERFDEYIKKLGRVYLGRDI